jgi:hypothetical protein
LEEEKEMSTRNIVPRATGEGSVGTSTKEWGDGRFVDLTVSDDLTVEGQISITGTSRCRVCSSSGQSIPDATLTKVEWGTETYDNLSEFASNKFTASAAGYYLITSTVTYADQAWVAGEIGEILIYVDGTAVSHFENEVSANVTKYMAVSITDILSIGANSYVEIYTKQSTGGAVALLNDDDFNWLAIHRLS